MPGLGRPVTEADLKAWDIAILGDGTGLPPGSGTSAQGAKIYAEKGCATCHGEGAKGGRNGPLVGSPPIDRIEAPKTIANFWGSATTIFDFTRRAMPYVQPQTLTNDEVYALTAFILEQNKIIGDERRHRCQDPAEGEDAEQRQLHHPVSRPDLRLCAAEPTGAARRRTVAFADEPIECHRPGAVERRPARRRDRHAQPARGQQRL